MSNKEERSTLSDVLGIVRGVLDKLLVRFPGPPFLDVDLDA